LLELILRRQDLGDRCTEFGDSGSHVVNVLAEQHFGVFRPSQQRPEERPNDHPQSAQHGFIAPLLLSHQFAMLSLSSSMAQ
jgi:hypothetical protein